MEKSLIIKKEIHLNISTEKVWDLLTNPEMTKQYMFGCEVISEWTLGSPIIWRGNTESKQNVTLVKGNITEIDTSKKVTFTMFDPNIGIKDIPENYVTLTYEISENNTGSLLKLTQNFEGTENAKNRFEESANGWDIVINLMKKLIE